MARISYHHKVAEALAASPKPLTRCQLQAALGIKESGVRKALRRMANEGAAHIYTWSRANAARAWAPVWAYGQGEHAPAPNGAKPVKSLPAKPKLDSQPEQMERTAHLAIPVTGCRTTFVGGVNPWGVVNPAFQKAQCESLIKHVSIA